MFQERARAREGLSLALDAAGILLAFGLAFLLRVFHESLPFLSRIPSVPWLAEQTPRSDYALLLVANVAVWLAVLRRSELYRRDDAERPERVLGAYVRGWILCMLASGTLVFLLKMGSISRLFVAYFFAISLPMLLGKQWLWVRGLRRARSRGEHVRHALVVGASRPAAWFAEVVRGAAGMGYRLIGLVLSDGRSRGTGAGDVPVLGGVDDLDRVLDGHPVEEVFVVGTARELAELAPVAQALIERGCTVSLVTTLSSGADGVRGRISDFSGVPLISYGPMPRDEVRSGVKRAIDVAVSAGALMLSLPVMLAVAAAIKWLDPGPVLFRQERLGLGGRRFRLYKFRSMRTDAEEVLRADPELYRRYRDGDYKLPEDADPRISPLGRWLRRTSLDELPQLWNVLRGDMALVGPRPIVPAEIDKYRPYAELFLSVRPGLTGRWQVAGRSSIPYPYRAFLDLDYAGSHSVGTDLFIMLRTVPVVLRRKGAF